MPNEVGGLATTAPENVSLEIKQLLKKYNSEKEKTFEDIVAFHHDFEQIHPFHSGWQRAYRQTDHVQGIFKKRHYTIYYR